MMIATNISAKAERLLPIVMLTVGMDYDQNPMYRPDGAEYYHIFYVEKGEGVLETGDACYDISEGTAIFMGKDVPMRYYGKSKVFKTAWVTFVGRGVDNIIEYINPKDFEFLKSEHIYSMIVNACKLAEIGAREDILSKNVYDILLTFFYELNTSKKPSALLLAKEYIDKNYASDISIPDIACFVGISESFLFKLFKKNEHMTPNDYLRAVRIRYAEQKLLSEPSLQIAEVAESCGFWNAAYFCKVFKEHTGMTPKKYQSKFGKEIWQ
jgi:AraC-like DNA-binding protein